MAIDLTEGPDDRQAKGTLTIAERKTNTTWRAGALGLIQTAKNWGSVTARLRDEASGAQRTLRLIVEQRDPWIVGRLPSVTFVLDGAQETTGPLTRGRIEVSDQ